VKQTLHPKPGKIVVHRETDEEFYDYRREITGAPKIEFGTEEAAKRKSSGWALVVGVGKSEKTAYGTIITTDVQEGDFVLVAQIGMDVRLDASDGTFTYVYVVPFDAVVAHAEVDCEACGYNSRKNVRQTVCPKCGVGPLRPVNLAVPTNTEVVAAGQGKR